MAEPGTLIKIGKKEHVAALYDEGVLYMNNLPHFWSIEDGEVRGDPHDGVDQLLRGTHAVFKDKNGNELPATTTQWTLWVPPQDADRINIFCMYALRPCSFPVNDRALQFGDTALVLTKAQVFIDRIAATMKQESLCGKADLVEYVPNDFAGEVGPLRKRECFAWQSEWRLVIENGPGGPRRLSIGSLQEIAIVVATADLNNTVKIDTNNTVKIFT